MVNDILEQAAEDYFRNLGYFTQHNVKYRLEKGVHSDIDLLGINPHKKGVGRVILANCKSWQGGLNIKNFTRDLEENKVLKRGKKMRDYFREFAYKEWANALIKKVEESTGQKHFELYTVVTVYSHGSKEDWEASRLFKQNLPKCKLKLISLKDMIQTLWPNITTTPEHSELSRLLQLIKADKGRIVY